MPNDMKRLSNRVSTVVLVNASAPAALANPFWNLRPACILMAAAALFLAACGKDSDAVQVTQADAVPINPEASAESQEKARTAQAVAMRNRVQPAPPAIKLRGGEPATPEVLAAYNQELMLYRYREQDAPETMQELLRIKSLPRLPTAPPGKRIVYDPANFIIKLESR